MEKNEKNATITVMPNGPFIIEGRFKLIDKDKKESWLDGKIALCRCGQSKNKPFCDGIHRKINFTDTES